ARSQFRLPDCFGRTYERLRRHWCLRPPWPTRSRTAHSPRRAPAGYRRPGPHARHASTVAPGARRLSLLSIPSTAVVTVMLAGMGARVVIEHSSRAAWLRQARSYLRNADPVLARLVDDRPDFDPWAWRDNAFGL